MSSMYNHRPMVPPMQSRFLELLEALKAEYEVLSQDLGLQRDSFEHKLQTQIGEINQIQKNLYDLERAHTKIKLHYEEEIVRLRRELESRGGPPAMQAPPQLSNSSVAPGTGIFGSSLPPVEVGHAPPSNSGPPSYYQGAPPPPQQVNQYANSSHLQKRMRTEDIPGGGGGSFVPQGGQPPNYPPMMMQDQRYYQSSAPIANNAPQPSSVPIAVVNKPKIATPSAAPAHRTQPAPPPQAVTASPAAPAVHKTFGDLDPSQIPASHKKEGLDWLAIYNPKVPRDINIELLHTVDHNSVVCCVRFSDDGKYLATGCNKSAQIYEVLTGRKVCTLIDESKPEGDLYIRSVCFSPDGKLLATGAEDKMIRIWDIESQKIKSKLTGHEQDIYSLDYSKNGQFIVSGSGDRTAKIWETETGKCLFTLTIEEGVSKDAGITSVAFSPDGRLVAAGSLDKTIRVWETSNGQLLEKYEGHKDSVYSVCFSPEGNSIISGSLDKTLKLWDLNSKNRNSCISTFSGHKDFVLSVAWAPDGNWIISGSKDRSVQFWDPRTANMHAILQGHKNSVISVAQSPQGRVFATGSGDCRARVWTFEDSRNS